MSDVLALTRELIARPSVTPDDAGCQQLIAERLLPLGFEVEWFHCGEVTNVLLTRGRGSPSLWLLGHTDVVPPGPEEAWASPPFEPSERDGLVYGRGACDMKGAVAAMVVALERFVESHPDHPGQIGLLLTSDEEGEAADGIRRVAEPLRRRGTAPDHCLVGEPSSRERLGDTARVGRRGSIVATLDVPGVQGHTAFPHTIDNPVHRLAPFLAALVAERWDDGFEDAAGAFPPTHCQVSNLNAGIGALQVTPPEARLMVSFRNNPASPSERLRERFETLLKDHGVAEYALDWWVSGEPFLSPTGALRSALRAAVLGQLGIEPTFDTGGGTSDGRFIAPLGSEVVELGLVNDSIHQIDERTAVADLEALARVYGDVLERIQSGR